MKHLLKSEWSLYGFTMPTHEEPPESYTEHIKLLARFSSIEDFWKAYSHIIRPSSLPIHGALHVFRGTSRAMREDPEHKDGGSFLFRVSKGMGPYYWEQLVLALIGERLPEDVIGILISCRQKFFNISVWHKTADDENLRQEICSKFCECIHLPLQTRIDYTKHNSVISSEENSGGKQTVHYILQKEGPVRQDIKPPHVEKQDAPHEQESH
ncbi:Eukaryotic initiation factor 4E family protein [Histomonas meleagridis]|uniref:Eukaryotic initiation factor 4E family protein n=1 Tax=Histomonas meleagridis TaxID=135588 RepID=UPI00355A58EB|nr:Eukaryotic initiation factor 4E family protein [Histomonas meleagridis]KAH0804942.1 Eukaryotic initiation factor 4E family protein [Histomonas meleagridis]